jgi:ACR3 family arsenite efflux pump ArsB
VAVTLAGLIVSSVALANVAGPLAQVLVLLATWTIATVARFALLRNWVFRRNA